MILMNIVCIIIAPTNCYTAFPKFEYCNEIQEGSYLWLSLITLRLDMLRIYNVKT